MIKKIALYVNKHPIRTSNRTLLVEPFSLKDNPESHPKLMEAVEKIKIQQRGANSKAIYDSINDFTYDDEKGIHIRLGNYNSYTFKILRTDTGSAKVENLIFSAENDTIYKAIIAKYDFTPEQLKAMTLAQVNEKEIKYQTIDEKTIMVCITLAEPNPMYQECTDNHHGMVCQISPYIFNTT